MIYKLGDLIDIKHGYAFSGEGITTEDNKQVLVTPGNFKIGGGFKEEKCKYFSGDIPEDYILKAGDLIVTMTDLSKQGDTLGYSARVPNNKDRTYLHNQRIGLIQLKSNITSVDYIYWFMRTRRYQKSVLATATGSTVKHTAPKRIQEIEIDVPSHEKQDKICSILNNLDEKIEINNKLNANLDELISNIFNDIFNLENVEYCPISNLMEVRDGTHDSPKAVEEGYPLITSKHLLKYGVNRLDANRISKSDYEKVNERSKVDCGDILLSMIGTVGVISFIIDEVVDFAIKNVALFKTSNNKRLQYFALSYLKHSKVTNHINMCLAGSTQKYISLAELRKLPFPLFNADKIHEFNLVVEPLYSKIKLINDENMGLIKLRDLLLPKLMSGELELSEVE